MKKAIALFLVAGAASFASAAGNVVVTGVPSAGSTGSGGSVTVELYADWSGVAGGLSLSGFKFDIVGNVNGTLSGAANAANFSNGSNNGISAAGNLLDFAGGQLPPGLGGTYDANPAYLGSVTFTDNGTAVSDYTVSLSIIDYVAPAGALGVYIGSTGTQSRSSLTLNTGNNHTVSFAIGSFDVIIPTPASMALLGLGGLVVGRRRR